MFTIHQTLHTVTIDRLDAEILLTSVLKKSRSHLYAYPEQMLTTQEYQQFQQWVQRREQGEPLAYLLGEKEFWSRSFCVNTNTLIPRPETETLIEIALEHLPSTPLCLADLGTGSGAIAITLAVERPQWQVFAIDNNTATLSIAQQNAHRYAGQNVHFIAANWLEACAEHSFDAIISNPPYLAADDTHLAALAFEPQHALIAGPTGLEAIEHIAQTALIKLKKEGLLVIEHGYQQHEDVATLLRNYGFHGIQSFRDKLQHWRVTMGKI